MPERKLGYTVPNVFGDYELDLALNYRYVAGYTIPDGSFIDTPLGALVELPSYDTYYFRAILRNDDWRFTAYVENLADDFNYNNLARGPFTSITAGQLYVTPLAPRHFGIMVARDL